MKETRRLNFHWADLEMSDVELKKLISHFALSNQSEGKSPETEAWYTEMRSDFVRWLQHNGKSTTLAEFNVKNVREFVIHMQERNLSLKNIYGIAKALGVALKAFFDF